MLADMGDCGTGLCTSSRYSQDRRTTEESTAAYVQVHFGTELGYRPVDMRLGVRYESTDISSQALSPAFTAINWIAGNELTAVQSSTPDFTSLDGSYDVVLPNFDFKIDLTDDLVGRSPSARPSRARTTATSKAARRSTRWFAWTAAPATAAIQTSCRSSRATWTSPSSTTTAKTATSPWATSGRMWRTSSAHPRWWRQRLIYRTRRWDRWQPKHARQPAAPIPARSTAGFWPIAPISLAWMLRTE